MGESGTFYWKGREWREVKQGVQRGWERFPVKTAGKSAEGEVETQSAVTERRQRRDIIIYNSSSKQQLGIGN